MTNFGCWLIIFLFLVSYHGTIFGAQQQRCFECVSESIDVRCENEQNIQTCPDGFQCGNLTEYGKVTKKCYSKNICPGQLRHLCDMLCEDGATECLKCKIECCDGDLCNGMLVPNDVKLLKKDEAPTNGSNRIFIHYYFVQLLSPILCFYIIICFLL